MSLTIFDLLSNTLKLMDPWKNWTFGKYMKMKRFFFTWDVLPSIWLWTFGLIENGNGFESGTHEMFKIRVDLRFQILVPVLM
ncbi:unnamed protein product [Rhizophagus irregularis]|nr:unnamed protein product [Rhizophagus irregularis]